MTAPVNTSFAMPLSEAVAKTDGPYQLHSLERAVSVLEALSESDTPLSLAEICQRMGLHKSTAHRSLMVLERSALIERTLENRFRLGLRLYELGNRAVEQIDLRARVYPFFRRLAAEVGETVHLGVLQKTSVVYLDKVEPNRRVCMSSKIGTSNPALLHLNGKGDAGLSARGDDRRNCCEDSLYALHAQDAVLAGEVARISENCAAPWVRH